MAGGNRDIAILILVIIAGALVWHFGFISGLETAAVNTVMGTEKPVNNVFFVCSQGKDFQVLFYTDTAHVHLSDGRNLILPEFSSGTTTIYADTGSPLEFVYENGGGYVEEGNPPVQTYTDCIPLRSNYS